MKETKSNLQLKLAHAVEALNRISEENERFKTRLREQMKAFGVITHSDAAQMLEIVLRQERKRTEEAIVGAKDFRDSCLIMLKSLEVVIESVECAGTHSEKNARLRGLADVVQRNINRLGRFEFCFDRSPWHAAYVDAFAREDPRVMKLREKVAALEVKLNPMEPREEKRPVLSATTWRHFRAVRPQRPLRKTSPFLYEALSGLDEHSPYFSDADGAALEEFTTWLSCEACSRCRATR